MLGTLLVVLSLGAAPNHDVGADFTAEMQQYLQVKLAESELRIQTATATKLAETERVLLSRVSTLTLQIEKLADDLAKQKPCICSPAIVGAAKPAAARPVAAAPAAVAYTAQSVWVPTKRGRGYNSTQWVPTETLPQQQAAQPLQSSPLPPATYCTKRGCFLVNPN